MDCTPFLHFLYCPYTAFNYTVFYMHYMHFLHVLHIRIQYTPYTNPVGIIHLYFNCPSCISLLLPCPLVSLSLPPSLLSPSLPHPVINWPVFLHNNYNNSLGFSVGKKGKKSYRSERLGWKEKKTVDRIA